MFNKSQYRYFLMSLWYRVLNTHIITVDTDKTAEKMPGEDVAELEMDVAELEVTTGMDTPLIWEQTLLPFLKKMYGHIFVESLRLF